MRNIISNNFTGIFNLQALESGFDFFFSVNGDVVTIIPETVECQGLDKITYSDEINKGF